MSEGLCGLQPGEEAPRVMKIRLMSVMINDVEEMIMKVT